jgi:hypothetical protein
MEIHVDRHVILDLDTDEWELLRDLMAALEDCAQRLTLPQNQLRIDLLLTLPGD